MTAEEVKAEVVSSPTTAAATPALPLGKKHPLKCAWSYWYLNDRRDIDWENRLSKVSTFNTVEDFWALYNNIKLPSQLNYTCDYNVFKEHIQPMWEVPENAKGGRWLISFEKSRSAETLDAVWLEILIAMIGEQFGEDMDHICGMVANIRAKGSKISVWTRDCNNDDVNLRIGNLIRDRLLSAPLTDKMSKPLFDVMKYEDHASCQTKTGSMAKVKHALYADASKNVAPQ